mmetsp:Transcript_42659/g.110281  ORF Transcript_42659/g.110281 Transcript_42659/m.110281 type:complete len:337 (+) Transcript_42659:1458-2468(+)
MHHSRGCRSLSSHCSSSPLRCANGSSAAAIDRVVRDSPDPTLSPDRRARTLDSRPQSAGGRWLVRDSPHRADVVRVAGRRSWRARVAGRRRLRARSRRGYSCPGVLRRLHSLRTRPCQQRLSAGPLLRGQSQHGAGTAQRLGKLELGALRDAVVGAHNPRHERLEVWRCAKWWPQRQHLEEHAAQRPDVRLVRVGFPLADLWAQVAGRADHRRDKLHGVRERSADTEVADGNGLLLVVAAGKLGAATSLAKDEDVRRLQVPVEDLVAVHVSHGAAELVEPSQGVILLHPASLLAEILEPLLQVATLTIRHEEAQRPAAWIAGVSESAEELYDVRMA